MSLNMKTFTQALAKASAAIEKTVTTTVQEVTGPRPLQDYELLDQVGSGGPGLAWRIYAARPRGTAPSAPYPLVSVWVLDKRLVAEARARAGLSRAAEEAFLDLARADAARMVRLRHPGVLHVVQALDESKAAMAMATEPVFSSVANVLGAHENFAKVPKELKDVEMGILEVKHGMLQLAETLDFLHNNARLVHRSISPETVFITSSGSWKFGGFGLAINIDQASGGLTSSQQFHYSDYDVEDDPLPLQPYLNYTAPELVRNGGSAVTSSCDMFSFGCLAYHLITRKPLLDCHNNVKMYMNSLSYLTSGAYSSIPTDLVVDLQRMLSVDASSRPSAVEFTGSSFFRDDTRLRALRFLDHMLERDNMQKTEFLKALSDMWKDFDSRVLRYKVLPPLCEELRNLVMQPMILPMVLTIAESQDRGDFELSTLPALVPVFASASGETLLLLVKHAEMIINKASHDHLISHILPMLVRAYDDTDPRIQEEALRRTVPLARQLDVQQVKQFALPRVHGLALKTTVAAVRVNALRCLGDLVSSLDKLAILEILQTIRRCTAVDHSAPTLMCTLGVANAIFKQCGIEFAAEHVVPLLFPLLTAQQLNVQQFAKYMLFIKDIMRKIEEKRGVTISEPGNPETKVSSSQMTNGVYSDPLQGPSKPIAPAKSSPAWDEDWGPPVRKMPAPPVHVAPTIQAEQPSFVPLNPKLTTLPVQSVPSNHVPQDPGSVASVDIEWPPRASSNVSVAASGGLPVPATSVDYLDPFANWPPKPSGSSGTAVGINFQQNSNPSVSGVPGFDIGHAGFYSGGSSTSIGQAKAQNISLNQQPFGSSALSTALSTDLFSNMSLNQTGSSSSVGHPVDAINMGYSFGGLAGAQPATGRAKLDFESAFVGNRMGQPTPRLEPPPPGAAGRGRGRNQGQSALSRVSQPAPPHLNAAASSQQNSFMDLLQ